MTANNLMIVFYLIEGQVGSEKVTRAIVPIMDRLYHEYRIDVKQALHFMLRQSVAPTLTCELLHKSLPHFDLIVKYSEQICPN